MLGITWWGAQSFDQNLVQEKFCLLSREINKQLVKSEKGEHEREWHERKDGWMDKRLMRWKDWQRDRHSEPWVMKAAGVEEHWVAEG